MNSSGELMTAPRPATNSAPERTSGSETGGGLAGWRISLTMARRDIMRYRGRAILSALLIALPLMVLTIGGTTLVTKQVSPAEKIPMQMGNAQALLAPGSPQQVVQDAEGSVNIADDRSKPALLIPGPGSAITRLQKLTGGILRAVSSASVRVTVGERRIRGDVLGIDGRQALYRPMAHLTSGRWPAAPDEIAVSTAGRHLGIPGKGTLSVAFDGKVRAMKVVGTVDTPLRQAIVSLPGIVGTVPTGYLLERAEPMRWSEVEKLNNYGVLVNSRYMIEHPSEAILAPMLVNNDPSNGLSTLMVLMAMGVVVVTVLLAGPAFSTGAARHRRALGQLASNGAPRAMLRKYVLAQAIWLGAGAAVLALGIGIVIAFAVVRVLQRMYPQSQWGPLEVPWNYAALVIGLAIISSLIAALAPAIAASRVSVLEVLRGQVTKHRVRVGWPLVGLVVAAIGGAIIVSTLTGENLAGGETRIVLGSLGLFGGAMVCVPWLMAQLAKLARFLPVSARIAARDVGRQRGRAVSGVGAVFAAVAVLTAFLIAGTSDNADQERTYLPSLPIGTGQVMMPPSAIPQVRAMLADVAPDVRTTELRTLGMSEVDPRSSDPTPRTGKIWVANVVAPGCRTDTAVPENPCSVASSSFSQILVLPAASLGEATSLTAAQRRTLAAGGMLVVDDSRNYSDSGWKNPVVNGGVKIDVGSQQLSSNGPGPFQRTRTVVLPAQLASRPTSTSAAAVFPGSSGFAALITAETAKAHGWPTEFSSLYLSRPGGQIDRSTELAITDRLPDSAAASFEHGQSTETERLLWVLTLVFALIVLIVATVGTALIQAESRSDQATLAAVGAPGSTRRAISAWHAFIISAVGVVIGFIIGAIPGIAVCWPLTGQSGFGPGQQLPVIVAIPWLKFAVITIGVPLVAAAMGWLMVRKAPPLTRRID